MVVADSGGQQNAGFVTTTQLNEDRSVGLHLQEFLSCISA